MAALLSRTSSAFLTTGLDVAVVAAGTTEVSEAQSYILRVFLERRISQVTGYDVQQILDNFLMFFIVKEPPP